MATAEFLYQQGRDALNCLGLLGNIYVCPICAVIFEYDALIEKTLTREHAPPASIGGRAVLLTCKLCNNSAGTNYDKQAIARKKFLDTRHAIFSNGTGKFGGIQLEANGISVNASFEKDSRGTSFEISAKHNDPKKIQTFHSAMAGKIEDLSVNLLYKSEYIARRASISDLKSCFILLTAKFGYKYALSDTLAQVRKQLVQPSNTIHAHVYTKAEGLPENSIFLPDNFGLVFLKFLGMAHVLPWPSQSYEHFLSYGTTEFKFSMFGKLFDFPKNFEAVLDKVGSLGLDLRIEPPK